MQIIITTAGTARCIYTEDIDLSAIGSLVITRASHVEPDQQGRWLADMSPLSGPTLGPFLNRSEALVAEYDWLEAHWLKPTTKQREVSRTESCPPVPDK